MRIPFEVAATRMLQRIPGVVRYVNVYNTADEFILVTERVLGATSLRAYMNQRALGLGLQTPLPELIFTQVVDIIADIHDRGYEHRDISVNNVLIESDTFRVTVIDLGLADFHLLTVPGKRSIVYFVMIYGYKM